MSTPINKSVEFVCIMRSSIYRRIHPESFVERELHEKYKAQRKDAKRRIKEEQLWSTAIPNETLIEPQKEERKKKLVQNVEKNYHQHNPVCQKKKFLSFFPKKEEKDILDTTHNVTALSRT